jgi:hypothetical protein
MREIEKVLTVGQEASDTKSEIIGRLFVFVYNESRKGAIFNEKERNR